MRRICRNEPTHVFAGVGLNAVEVVAGVLDVLRFDEGFQKARRGVFCFLAIAMRGGGNPRLRTLPGMIGFAVTLCVECAR